MHAPFDEHTLGTCMRERTTFRTAVRQTFATQFFGEHSFVLNATTLLEGGWVVASVTHKPVDAHLPLATVTTIEFPLYAV